MTDINPDLSSHIETVVLLSKGEVDSKKIRVEFSLEDMDICCFVVKILRPVKLRKMFVKKI